jgi:alpha-ketoglutarate-dependent taurine dioxygenase
MQLERLTTYIGARVSGIDLATVVPSDREMIRDLLEKHLVLFFVGQSMGLAKYRALGEIIGELERTPSVA